MKKLVVAHDEVFIVGKETACRRETCTICGGTGNVTLKNKVFVCPQCEGAGSRLGHTETEWMVKGPAVLSSILLQRTEDGFTEEYTYDVPVVSDYFRGTRSVKPLPSDVFSSFMDAEKEAERRNEEEARNLCVVRKAVAL